MAIKWRNFQEAVAAVHAQGGTLGFDSLTKVLELSGPQPCPAPEWDRQSTYEVNLIGGKKVIRKLTPEGWIDAPLYPPTPQTKEMTSMEPKTESMSILFMDVTGWSKLELEDVAQYVTLAMPKLSDVLINPMLKNTWGDAIVATFRSAVDAAKSALEMRDLFKKLTRREGIPAGLSCRIALHHGEVLLCHNAILGRSDMFGMAVNTAARLEPMTERGHVFCTESFANMLGDVKGMGPKAWPLGSITLPKGHGTINASVVTWSNEGDPSPSLSPTEPEAPKPTARPRASSTPDAKVKLETWLRALHNDKSAASKSYSFTELDEQLSLAEGLSKSILPQLSVQEGGWEITAGDDVFHVTYRSRPHPPPKARTVF